MERTFEAAQQLGNAAGSRLEYLRNSEGVPSPPPRSPLAQCTSGCATCLLVPRRAAAVTHTALHGCASASGAAIAAGCLHLVTAIVEFGASLCRPAADSGEEASTALLEAGANSSADDDGTNGPGLSSVGVACPPPMSLSSSGTAPATADELAPAARLPPPPEGAAPAAAEQASSGAPAPSARAAAQSPRASAPMPATPDSRRKQPVVLRAAMAAGQAASKVMAAATSSRGPAASQRGAASASLQTSLHQPYRAPPSEGAPAAGHHLEPLIEEEEQGDVDGPPHAGGEERSAASAPVASVGVPSSMVPDAAAPSGTPAAAPELAPASSPAAASAPAAAFAPAAAAPALVNPPAASPAAASMADAEGAPSSASKPPAESLLA